MIKFFFLNTAYEKLAIFNDPSNSIIIFQHQLL